MHGWFDSLLHRIPPGLGQDSVPHKLMRRGVFLYCLLRMYLDICDLSLVGCCVFACTAISLEKTGGKPIIVLGATNRYLCALLSFFFVCEELSLSFDGGMVLLKENCLAAGLTQWMRRFVVLVGLIVKSLWEFQMNRWCSNRLSLLCCSLPQQFSLKAHCTDRCD